MLFFLQKKIGNQTDVGRGVDGSVLNPGASFIPDELSSHGTGTYYTYWMSDVRCQTHFTPEFTACSLHKILTLLTKVKWPPLH